MFKVLKIILLVFIVMFSAIVGVGFTIFGWDRPGCGEDSEAVAFARSLSEERLEKLYFDFESLSKSTDVSEIYSSHGEGESLPAKFVDLKVVKLRPTLGYILVQGCMDHGVVMDFSGFTKETEKKITLSWGEVPLDGGSEVIWMQR